MVNIKEMGKDLWGKVKGLYEKIGVRNLMIAGSVLLIGAAVWLNFALFNGNDEPADIGYGSSNMTDNVSADADKAKEEDYFASTQLSREKARNEALQVLQSVVDSGEAVEATREQALTEITKIANDIKLESNIETLVLSKGFEQCVAVVGGDTVNIIVKSNGLLPNELSQIHEIVYEQTGIVPANVKVIEKNY